TIQAKYDYFMTRARANLREDPGYYLRNVRESYDGCLRLTAESARANLPLASLLLALGLAAAAARAAPSPGQAAGGALVVGLAWLGFRAVAASGWLLFDLAALAALPLVTWGRLGALPLLSGLFAILGVAMFGMRAPGRLTILLEWTFLLAYLAALSACSALALRLVGSRPAAEEAAPVGGLPRWFVLARAA